MNTKKDVETKELFTWITIITSIIAFICFGFMMNLLSSHITDKDSLFEVPMSIIRTTQMMTAISFISLVISYIKKETKTWKTWIATIISLLLFMLVFVSVGIVYLFE